MTQVSATHRVLTTLLGHLVRRDGESAGRLLDADPTRIPELCALLDRTRLSGYFHCLIRDTELCRFFPDETLQSLGDAYRMQAERNDRNLRVMEQIRERFDASSLPFLILKGLYVAQRFFGDIHHRFMWDIDILVHPGDLERALEVLANLHYSAASGVRVDPRRRFWGIHAVEVSGPGGKIDVHHTIRNVPGIHLDHDRLWREAQQFSVTGRTFSTLSETDTLLAAALGLGTDLQAGHHNLRKIWDVFMMLRELDAGTDWEAFFERRHGEGSLKLVLNVLCFTLLLCGSGDAAPGTPGAAVDCPQLVEALSGRRSLLMIRDREQADSIFLRPRQHLANRLLFSRLVPVSPIRYWLGWLATLAVRVWHYRTSGRPAGTTRSPSG